MNSWRDVNVIKGQRNGWDLNILADLVFFQNGMLDPWLQSKGLSDANQVLAYFAISKLGEAPVDGKTDTNPEGLTAAYGKWASAVATRLHNGGLSCKVAVSQFYFLVNMIVMCLVLYFEQWSSCGNACLTSPILPLEGKKLLQKRQNGSWNFITKKKALLFCKDKMLVILKMIWLSIFKLYHWLEISRVG